MGKQSLFEDACESVGGDVEKKGDEISCTLKSEYKGYSSDVATLTMSDEGILVNDDVEDFEVSPQSLKIILDNGIIFMRNPIKER